MQERDLGRFAPQHSSNKENLEIEARKETLYTVRFGGLGIAAKPGAGSSSLAEREAETFQIPLYKVGDLVRKKAGVTERSTGFIKRRPSVDFAVDEGVRGIVRNANIQNPLIFEAQIGCLTALDEYRKLEFEGAPPNAPIVKVLIWATKEIRIDRLKAASDSKGENKSRAQIERETTDREKNDPVYWKSLYPDLVGEDNPLEMGARDAQGKRIYDFEINSTDLTADEVQQELNDFLLGLKLIERKSSFLIPNQRRIWASNDGEFLQFDDIGDENI